MHYIISYPIMGLQWVWRHLLCCCGGPTATVKESAGENQHLYCGCVDVLKSSTSASGSTRSKTNVFINMKTVKPNVNIDNKRTVVEDEENNAVDALDFEFVSEQLSCVEKPDIPFRHELIEPARPNLDIIIEGTVKENSLRFVLDLEAKSKDNTDIVFHFNPRLSQNYTVCNSFTNNKWDVEKHSAHQKFPFQRNKPFFLELFLTHSKFLVAVDGVHYCSFPYRTNIKKITDLVVDGGVMLSRVHLHYTSFYPSPLPAEYPASPYRFALPEGLTVNETLTTPLYGYLQGKLTSGSQIEINGLVELLPHSFYINLQEGSHIWPHPEVPLHISVRFVNVQDEVRVNCWTNSTWGKEERLQNCPFTPGYYFNLKITCNDDAFDVHVNNVPQLSFKHRVPFTNIDTLHIQGQVFIYDIRIRL